MSRGRSANELNAADREITAGDSMNIKTTNELIYALCELRCVPEWRMGQLVANLATAAGNADPNAVWDVEDEQLLAAARRLIERNRGRGNPS